MEYFVYRLMNGKTYGDFVYCTEDYDLAVKEAEAHKKVTDCEYGVFKHQCCYNTSYKI